MKNLKFREKTPPIDRFPNDNIFRVVWAYGSVQKGSTITGIPEIHVLLVELTFNNSTNEYELSKQTKVVKISIAQLDTVRYMTIWKGQKRINGCWENFTMRFKNEANKLYYVYVNDDFDKLETLPQLLFQYPDEKISAIDADITRIGDKYHMFYVSHDGGAGIKQAVSDRVNSDYKYNARWYDPEPTACEAPNLWKRIGEDRWVLMYDVYGQKVHNFGFSETSDFVHFTPLGQFNQGVMRTTNFTSPKHGAIIHLTRQEAERLAEHWGMSYDALLPSE
jgi:hypothetical protein